MLASWKPQEEFIWANVKTHINPREIIWHAGATGKPNLLKLIWRKPKTAAYYGHKNDLS